MRADTERYRDILLVVLTLTTGAFDAVTFVRLGKVFSSVITGNLALLGIGAGRLARNAYHFAEFFTTFGITLPATAGRSTRAPRA